MKSRNGLYICLRFKALYFDFAHSLYNKTFAVVLIEVCVVDFCLCRHNVCSWSILFDTMIISTEWRLRLIFCILTLHISKQEAKKCWTFCCFFVATKNSSLYFEIVDLSFWKLQFSCFYIFRFLHVLKKAMKMQTTIQTILPYYVGHMHMFNGRSRKNFLIVFFTTDKLLWSFMILVFPCHVLVILDCYTGFIEMLGVCLPLFVFFFTF